MKIAFIGQKGIPIISGGVERRVEELSTRMTALGHEVFVYVRNDYASQKPSRYKGVNLIYIPAIPTKNLGAISHTFFAIMHALVQNYDVIHFQAPGPSSLCWIIKILKPRTALIATFNSRDSQHQKWSFLAKHYLLLGEWVMIKIPDKTIAVSNILQKYIKEKFGVEAEVIRNGSSVSKTTNINLIEKWNLKKNRYFLSVSRLIRHKGIHLLIEAFKQAQKDGRISLDFKLVIVGEGAFTDDYVEELKMMADQDENIVFTGNQVGENLAALFQCAFSFVQPSLAEGLSNALLESMGYGLCPIISDIEENVSPVGENGIVFEKQNLEDLKNKLIFAFEHKELVQKLGDSARTHVEKKYSWEKNAEKTLALYRKVLNKKRTSGFLEKTFKNSINFNL